MFITAMSNLNLIDTFSDYPINSWSNWLTRVIPTINSLIPVKTKTLTAYPNKKYLCENTMILKND